MEDSKYLIKLAALAVEQEKRIAQITPVRMEKLDVINAMEKGKKDVKVVALGTGKEFMSFY